MWQDDPLKVCATTKRCPSCEGIRKRRKKCKECNAAGFPPYDLSGLWAPRAAFLVCGGPSLRDLSIERLKDRGVASLGINNAGAYAPVKAHTFSDEQIKFHSAQFMDPGILSFVPFGKLFFHIQIKHEGRFVPTNIRPIDCPSVFGFSRDSKFDGSSFLTTPYAMWGHGGPEAKEKSTHRRLCTTLTGIRLLHYLGCSRIYLLGVDHHIAPRDSDTPGYAWGDNASSGNKIWFKIDNYFDQIKPVCEAAGLTVFNCNAMSHCESFEHVPFDEALADCKGPVEDEPLDIHDWYNKTLAKEQHKEFGDPLSEQQVYGLRFNARFNQTEVAV
jgi:hypothetical protein